MFDYLGVDASRRQRFSTGAAAGMVWLAMGELWMFDLTAPGYVVVFLVFGSGYGLVSLVAGNGDRRILALPAAFALYEWVRWSWPFGGVPLATAPMTQVNSVLAEVLPLGGPVLLTMVTVLTGSALRLLATQRYDMAGMALGAVTVTILAGVISPGSTVIDEISVAVVQGGGPQRTRADAARTNGSSIAIAKPPRPSTKRSTSSCGRRTW